MQFERNRSNDYYDEQLYSIDEQICALLKKRHELSNKKPGCPPDEVVSIIYVRQYENASVV